MAFLLHPPLKREARAGLPLPLPDVFHPAAPAPPGSFGNSAMDTDLAGLEGRGEDTSRS